MRGWIVDAGDTVELPQVDRQDAIELGRLMWPRVKNGEESVFQFINREVIGRN